MNELKHKEKKSIRHISIGSVNIVRLHTFIGIRTLDLKVVCVNFKWQLSFRLWAKRIRRKTKLKTTCPPKKERSYQNIKIHA